MMITKKSMFSGQAHTMDLPVTRAQLDRWQGGELIQDVFPFLSRAEREFIVTGTTQDEWDQEFGASGAGYAGEMDAGYTGDDEEKIDEE